MKHQHNKGKIQDNAIKALVRSNLFRYRTEKPKKGKGSYNRQAMKKATSNGGFYFVIKNSLTIIVLGKIKNMIERYLISISNIKQFLIVFICLMLFN